MLERQIPDRECLELGIAGIDSPFVLMVKLGEAGRKLSRARPGSGDDHERPARLDVFIFAISLVAHDQVKIVRIPLDNIVQIYPDPVLFQVVLKEDRAVLILEMRYAHRSHIETAVTEFIDQTQDVGVIRDSEIPAYLVVLYIDRRDDDDHFRLIPKLHEHLQFGIRLKAGKDAGRVVIVEKLPAEFQIELSAELADTLPDVLGLHFDVLLVAETDFHIFPLSGCTLMPSDVQKSFTLRIHLTIRITMFLRRRLNILFMICLN